MSDQFMGTLINIISIGNLFATESRQLDVELIGGLGAHEHQ